MEVADMLGVVIADDEVNICALVRGLIDWQAMSLELIGMAHSGSAARDMILQRKPDIAILDIKMPGIDGLEIIREAHAAGLQTRFLLISGHKNFEYAHTAIKYGVERYLLKPINREELQENLCQISAQIRADRDDRVVLNNLKGRLARNADFNRKYFLYNLYGNTLTDDLNDIEALNGLYDTHFKPGRFVLAVLHLDGKTDYDPSQMDMLLNRVRDHFDDCLGGAFYDAVSMKLPCDVAALLNGADDASLSSALFKYCDQARKKWYPYGNLTVALSRFTDSLALIRPEEAIRASFFRLTLGSDRLIEYEINAFDPVSLCSPEDQRAFINAFDAFNTRPVDEWLDRKRALILNPRSDAYDIYRDFVWITDHLINERLRAFLSQEDFRVLQSRDEFALRQAGTRQILLDAFYGIFSANLNRFIAEQKKSGSKYIQQAKHYISQHYAQNVALEDIAKIIYVNPVYFSVLFKKEEGINFSDYLTQYRMEKAKELLRGAKKYNMDQISAMVGYQDARYFSKLFTKLVGVKPSDYRRLY